MHVLSSQNQHNNYLIYLFTKRILIIQRAGKGSYSFKDCAHVRMT